jgi:hypothetical protein
VVISNYPGGPTINKYNVNVPSGSAITIAIKRVTSTTVEEAFVAMMSAIE